MVGLRSDRQGLLIISGMARGVDTASHRGAIADKGKTFAVFWDRLT
ncbi:MAG TPA: DNA-processing protein DprA [Candidatus Acidoferrales bacterium]|nr:DNA-processing protein DprA [Candidatus Acidoferrales bacterium]